MEVKINTQGKETTAQLIGRLDTPASQEISGDFDNLTQFAAGTIILDCSGLEYISSSGLSLEYQQYFDTGSSILCGPD